MVLEILGADEPMMGLLITGDARHHDAAED
jgi:hypothetical protein